MAFDMTVYPTANLMKQVTPNDPFACASSPNVFYSTTCSNYSLR